MKKLIKSAWFKSMYKWGRVFKVNNGFFFVVNIPDDLVGCSGSRCSHCGSKSAYCYQVCKKCNLPFIGPFGFPQIIVWRSLAIEKRKSIVEEIFINTGDRGRLGYVGMPPVPLTFDELGVFMKNTYEYCESSFSDVHGVIPKDIGCILLH